MNTQKITNGLNSEIGIKIFIFVMTFIIGGIFFLALKQIYVREWYDLLLSLIIVIANAIGIRREFKKLTKK